jgi:hypothetical protein
MITSIDGFIADRGGLGKRAYVASRPGRDAFVQDLVNHRMVE